MDKLIYTLKHLPGPGRRLENGLAVRISRGNGFAVLGASRVGQAPGEQEMKILQTAVLEIWHPSHIWRDTVTVRKRVLLPTRDRAVVEVEDHIWRLYWPLTALELVYEYVEQRPLLFDEVAK